MHTYILESEKPERIMIHVTLTRLCGAPALVINGYSVAELMPDGMLRLPGGSTPSGMQVDSNGRIRIAGHPDPADVRALVNLVEKFTTPGVFATSNDVDTLRKLAVKVSGQL